MKINRLIALLACAMAFPACQDDMQEASVLQNKIYTLTGKMSGENTMSRAQIALGNQTSGSGEIAYWNKGDEFSLYQGSGDSWSKSVFTISSDYSESGADNKTATFSTKTPAIVGSYVALYPSNRPMEGNSMVNFAVDQILDFPEGTDPNEIWKSYLQNNMFMIASGTLSETGVNTVNFEHLMSLTRISYTNQSEDKQQISEFGLGGSICIASEPYIDLCRDEHVLYNSWCSDNYNLATNGLTVEAGDTIDLYLLFCPTEFDENGNLDINFNYANGDGKTATMPLKQIAQSNNGYNGFEAGKRYWFHLTGDDRGLYFSKEYTTDVVTIQNPELSLVLKDALQEQNISVEIDEKTNFATISQMDVNKVTKLSLGYREREFSSLDGIQHFKNLKILNVEGCGLQDTLKIPAFDQLEELNVAYNRDLTEIDFSGMSTLKKLDISYLYGWATTQRVKEVCALYPALESLSVHNNGLTELELPELSNLGELLCYDNDLRKLDLSNRTDLRIVDCSNNHNLTELNLTGCNGLDKVAVQGCDPLAALDIPNRSRLDILLYSDTQITFTEENLKDFTSVTRLGCGSRFNGSLGIPEAMKGRLVYLDCHNNQLATLNLVEYPNLQSLLCYENQLTSLDVDSVKNLEDLYCYGNRIDALDVSSLDKLWNLECGLQDSDNGVLILKTNEYQKQRWNEYWKQFDANQGVGLEGEFSTKEILFTNKQFAAALYNVLGSNKVTLNPVDGTAVMLEGHVLSTTELNFADKNLTVASFDGIEEFKNLESLICNNIGLTTLDVSALTRLKNLYCSDNSLKELEVSENTSLTFLYCGWNDLTKLDVSKNVNLTTLGCHSNEISVLDITNNILLESLGCSDNNLTELDITNNVNLWTLGCSGNELSVLDLTNNIKLQDLYCYNNRLNALDITKNSVLRTLECGGQKDIETIVVTMTTSQFSTWESTWSTGNNNDSTIEAKVIIE